MDPLEFLALRVVPTEPPAIHQLHLGFPTQQWSLHGVCPWVPAPVSCNLLYLVSVSLSHLGGSGLPCVIPSLMDPRIVVDFLFCSVLYFLLRQYGKFEAELEIRSSQLPFCKNKLNFALIFEGYFHWRILGQQLPFLQPHSYLMKHHPIIELSSPYLTHCISP